MGEVVQSSLVQKDWMLTMPGQLTRNERQLLSDTVKEAKAKFEDVMILNVGIQRGASCYCLRHGSRSAKLFGIDIEGSQKLVGREEQLAQLNLKTIEGNSNEVEFTLPLHVLFIDGGHEPETVRGDIHNLAKNVVPGGFILFHDAIDEKYGVKVSKAIDTTLPEGWRELESVDSIRRFVR